MQLFDWFREDRPNNFTTAMGDLIRQARQERGMNQEELAEKIFKRRPSISEMENGKMEPSAGDLFMLAVALEKPLTYFLGKKYLSILRHINPEIQPLAPEEEEILMLFKRLENATKKAALIQLHTLVELDRGIYDEDEDEEA